MTSRAFTYTKKLPVFSPFFWSSSTVFFSLPYSSLALYTRFFSLSQTLHCATLELQQPVIVQPADKLLGIDQWYHPIVRVLPPAPKSMESWERGGKRTRNEDEGGKQESWEGWRTGLPPLGKWKDTFQGQTRAGCNYLLYHTYTHILVYSPCRRA